MNCLHPVARYAEFSARIALQELEREIEMSETAREATLLYDRIEALQREADRLSLVALRRAEFLCGRTDVRTR